DTFIADGSTINTGLIVPRISALGGPLGQEQDVRFKVNLNTKAPGNAADDGSPIPLDEIAFIGLKGAAEELGAWAGDWTAADTTAGNMLGMHDDGAFGDATAGDNIWTRIVTFADTTARGVVEYKYGAEYTSNPLSSAPLDNCGGFGINYSVDVQPTSGIIELDDEWLTAAGPVGIERLDEFMPSDYELSQNYPNPFNPTTVIRYSIPEAAHVRVTVHNLIGEIVATLVDGEQSASFYEVSFDASKLSSGLYFYTIQAGKFVSTKKMMLMK
ncbi:MAG: T9SS type A sorting domain-containing protein, partial [Melioribacteraceae bacterium]|nr:T9SS type A sorting domain-containing protein [Melioribacteraceae bacterium]